MIISENISRNNITVWNKVMDSLQWRSQEVEVGGTGIGIYHSVVGLRMYRLDRVN